MLSIGKLVAGQERYYQAQIARGLDDYYAGRGEAPGRWVGAGAASLGVEGLVREGQLGALIAGGDPRSGKLLREQETRVAALDLTFSAPKSVSVLFAVAPHSVSRALVRCHEEAPCAPCTAPRSSLRPTRARSARCPQPTSPGTSSTPTR